MRTHALAAQMPNCVGVDGSKCSKSRISEESNLDSLMKFSHQIGQALVSRCWTISDEKTRRNRRPLV